MHLDVHLSSTRHSRHNFSIYGYGLRLYRTRDSVAHAFVFPLWPASEQALIFCFPFESISLLHSHTIIAQGWNPVQRAEARSSNTCKLTDCGKGLDIGSGTHFLAHALCCIFHHHREIRFTKFTTTKIPYEHYSTDGAMMLMILV